MAFEVRGYAAKSATAPLAPFSFQRRALKPGDVLIDIKFSGICHSDIHQARDEWGGSTFPMVPGHEIAGVVSQVGQSVTRFKVGDRVGVGCMVDSCRSCEYCLRGDEQYCDVGMVGTYNSVERDGSAVTQGGYSNRIVVDENFVLKIPSQLELDVAAPLLCAGITVYSPLKHWKAGRGKKVAVVGLGGLGHMAVKIASRMGAEVSVISQSNRKRDDALKMGAKNFYATSESGTLAQLKKSFDLIINTVSAQSKWSRLLSCLKVDGNMVVVGIPEEDTSLSAFALVGARRSLAGSMIGGIRETQEMLDFCAQHGIACDIEKIAIADVNKAYDRVVKSDVRYRFVIDMATL